MDAFEPQHFSAMSFAHWIDSESTVSEFGEKLGAAFHQMHVQSLFDRHRALPTKFMDTPLYKAGRFGDKEPEFHLPLVEHFEKTILMLSTSLADLMQRGRKMK